MNSDKFLIITAQEYSKSINLKGHIKSKKILLFIVLLAFAITLIGILADVGILSLFFPTYFHMRSTLGETLFGLMGFVILGILCILLAYIKLQELKMISYLGDIYITSKGISLPFPYDKITKERFVEFKDIRKIIVYELRGKIYMLIWFELKKKFKPWNPIVPPTQIDLLVRYKEGEKIISTIKLITHNTIEIEYRR